MIEGAVYGRTNAIVELTLRGPDGQEERLDFKVDTGFDGDRVILCDLCKGRVEWGGVSRSVDVQVSDSVSLLGMALLAGHQVRIDVVNGGLVRITPLMQIAA
jgi:predicted aspartyl protease